MNISIELGDQMPGKMGMNDEDQKCFKDYLKYKDEFKKWLKSKGKEPELENDDKEEEKEE